MASANDVRARKLVSQLTDIVRRAKEGSMPRNEALSAASDLGRELRSMRVDEAVDPPSLPQYLRKAEDLVTRSLAFLSEGQPTVVSAPVVAPAVVEGWLFKKGHKRTNWKRRWFVLRGGDLLYHPSKEEGKVLGRIVLDESAKVEALPDGGYANMFRVVVRNVEYPLHADTAADRASWLAAIESAIKRTGARNMALWSPDDVCSYFRNMGCEDVSWVWREKITGEALMLLGEADLKDLGVPLGIRKMHVLHVEEARRGAADSAVVASAVPAASSPRSARGGTFTLGRAFQKRNKSSGDLVELGSAAETAKKITDGTKKIASHLLEKSGELTEKIRMRSGPATISSSGGRSPRSSPPPAAKIFDRDPLPTTTHQDSHHDDDDPTMVSRVEFAEAYDPNN